VTVSQDTSALDNAAQSLVTALNQVLGTINKNATYSQTSGAGPLFGDVGIEIIRSDLLDAISNPPNADIPPSTPYSSLSSVGFTVTSGGTVTFDQSTFQKAAQSNYTAVAALLGEVGQATNPNVAVAGLGSAVPGSYAVAVASNSDGAVSGSVNGEAANGTGGLLVVNGDGTALGLSLQIAPGATGDLGTVTISQGIFSSLSSIINAAVASGTGSVAGQIADLNTTITTMNTQVNQMLAEAQQETQELTQQYSVAQATLSQLTTVSDFLTTYFNQTSGSSG
jgi:flagellar hook-associated protein 2